jgi:hypothetical protein
MALTTRPSQPSEGRTAPATGDTTAGSRAARLRARRTASAARCAGKADHLAGDRRPAPVSISTRAPTDMAWIGPRLDHQAAHADDASVNLDPSSSRSVRPAPS